jgi:hypothetical protein
VDVQHNEPDRGPERATARRSARAVLLHWLTAALLLVQWAGASAFDSRQLLRGNAPWSAHEALKTIPSGTRPSERVSISERDWTTAVREVWDLGPDPVVLAAIFVVDGSFSGSVLQYFDEQRPRAVAHPFHARAPPAAV